MAYLIDGNNFLGLTVAPVYRDPQHRYDLVRKLLIFQRLTRSRIILVFDGPPDPHLEGEEFDGRSFNVLFPPRGLTADALIKELLDARRDLRHFFLVSSDRELKSAARSRGATVLACGEFNAMLKEALKKNRSLREMSKTAEKPSPLEVGLWSDLFAKK
jgi:predicted RNA-binding protein with PIN domain